MIFDRQKEQYKKFYHLPLDLCFIFGLFNKKMNLVLNVSNNLISSKHKNSSKYIFFIQNSYLMVKYDPIVATMNVDTSFQITTFLKP